MVPAEPGALQHLVLNAVPTLPCSLKPPGPAWPEIRLLCRTVKLATPEMVSYGGLTTITNYHLIPKQEDVVESQFMHDKFSSPTGVPTGGSYSSPMVVATKRRVFSLADDSDSD